MKRDEEQATMDPVFVSLTARTARWTVMEIVAYVKAEMQEQMRDLHDLWGVDVEHELVCEALDVIRRECKRLERLRRYQRACRKRRLANRKACVGRGKR